MRVGGGGGRRLTEEGDVALAEIACFDRSVRHEQLAPADKGRL